MGRLERQRVCADTILSSSTCLCTLVAVSFYDAVRSHLESMEDTRRSTVRCLTGLALGLILITHLALALASPNHYTVDIVIAVPITMLVYSNAAVALVTDKWVVSWATMVLEQVPYSPMARSSATSRPNSADGLLDATLTSPKQQAPMGAAQVGTADSVVDFGQATLPPCCIPFCAFGGMYYLRSQALPRGMRSVNNMSERQQQQQSEFSETRERAARAEAELLMLSNRSQKLEADIKRDIERRFVE